MKIKCLSGYFVFEEEAPGQLSDFISVTGMDLEKSGDFHTFKELKDPGEFSINGMKYFDEVATATYEGDPWDIFKANKLAFDFTRGLVVPIASITKNIELKNAGNYFVSNGLIIPGSILETGEKIMGYLAYYSANLMSYRYSEVERE